MALQLPPEARPEVALHEQLPEPDRGLVYDLSTLIDRRQVLKLAGFTTISAGLMSITACAPGRVGIAAGLGRPRPRDRSAPARRPRHDGRRDCAVIPEETAGPYPGRRLERPQRPEPERDRPQGHPLELRHVDDKAAGVPLTIKLTIQDARQRLRAAPGRRRLPLALRPGRQLLALLAGRRERELPARRPGDRRLRRRHVHSRSFPRATRAAGRTSTSRSTRISRRRPTRRTRSRPPRSPSPRTPAPSSTQRPATRAASGR